MAQALRARLPGIAMIDWVAATGSTNTDLLAELRSRRSPAQIRVLGAHLQRTGRGRAGRTLHNQTGDTLMFSCVFPVHMPAARLPSVSPVVGLAACEVLRRHARPDCTHALRLKWPNDIQLGEAKLAGLLVESVRDVTVGPAAHAVVVGMGMNLRNAPALAQALQRPVADWSQAAGGTPLDALVTDVIQAWREALQTCSHDGFAAFQPRFQAVDALFGRTVNVMDNGRILYSGVAQGTDPDGRLCVDDGAGPVAVSVGDISIRPQQP